MSMQLHLAALWDVGAVLQAWPQSFISYQYVFSCDYFVFFHYTGFAAKTKQLKTHVITKGDRSEWLI